MCFRLQTVVWKFLWRDWTLRCWIAGPPGLSLKQLSMNAAAQRVRGWGGRSVFQISGKSPSILDHGRVKRAEFYLRAAALAILIDSLAEAVQMSRKLPGERYRSVHL